MAATPKIRLQGLGINRAEKETAGLRLAQNAILSELPGAAFAFITLAWIVTSMAGLL